MGPDSPNPQITNYVRLYHYTYSLKRTQSNYVYTERTGISFARIDVSKGEETTTMRELEERFRNEFQRKERSVIENIKLTPVESF